MLNTALALTVATGVVAQVYPDELDILRGADTRPQMELVMDTSCSMGGGPIATTCAHFYNTVSGYPANPGFPLDKMDMLKAVLTGCQTATDGVLDQWANRVFFALREFGGLNISVPPGGAFSPNLTNRAALEGAVLGLSPGGGTPLAEAFAQGATSLATYWSDTNSAKCRQNFVVLMTDGDGNGAQQPTLALGAGNAAITFSDTFSGNPAPYADAAARHLARSDSSYGTFVDSMPNITGVQPIRTYTIGFGGNISAIGQSLLQNMATLGDGQYYAAVSYGQLNTAFTQIILSVVARSNVAFNPGTVQNDGLFSGNYVYASSFKPYSQGFWNGTTKKHCVMPANAADRSCIFMDDGAGNLITNPTPVDVWTGSNNVNADVGGSGQMIWSNLFGGVTSPADPVPANPLNRRRIYTWRPGSNAYVRVDGTGTWRRQDSFARNDCDHYSLLNRLHGYTDAVTDCAARNYAPVALEQWPLGDTVHGDTVLMKYTSNCEAGGDTCYVATVANDGMLHFFNAANGVETSAIIPGHLWSKNQIGIHQLRDVSNQPNLSEMRRYYFDGGMRLFHDDANANGYIDNGETAKLIAGLGRGGRSYILWDVSTFNGIPSVTNNPPQELMVDQSSSFKHLRETWAAPWMGRYRHADSNLYNVAVFPSGHERELDRPTASLGGAAMPAGIPPPPVDSRTTPNVRGCPAFFSQLGPAGTLGAMMCNPPIPTGGCTPCNSVGVCTPPGLLGVIGPNFFCYDWPGWMGIAPPPFNGSGGPGVGHDILLGPFSWSDANYYSIGYQLVFNTFDLQANDFIAVLDSNQNEVGRITGSQAGGATSAWVDDTSFYIRLKTDGIDSGPSGGFTLQRVNLIRTRLPGAVGGASRPTIYMVDLNRWNGAAGALANRFPTQPGAGNRRQETGVLLRVTSDCEGLQVAGEVCIDATGSGGEPAMPDLAYMTCPISMEPSVLEEGGLAEGIYWGDECGQIFRATRDTSGLWTAKRLLHTNNISTGAPVAGASKDHRKLFADLEIVRSTCNGGSAVGVYFGTGNLQRPALIDNLQSTTVARFPGMLNPIGISDVFGVVWDHPSLPANAGLDSLENISLAIQVVDPRAGNARNGWFVEMTTGAKILRSPLVFDGVAYFRDYAPLTLATECISATGREVTYAVNNCTGRPATDGNNNGTVGDSITDRYVEQTNVDIGGEMALYTPPNSAPMVTTGGAKPQQTQRRRATRFMMWRTIVDPLF